MRALNVVTQRPSDANSCHLERPLTSRYLNARRTKLQIGGTAVRLPPAIRRFSRSRRMHRSLRLRISANC